MNNTTGLNNIWFYGNWQSAFYYVIDDKVRVYVGLDDWKSGIYTEFDIVSLAKDYEVYILTLKVNAELEEVSLDILTVAIDDAIRDYSTGLAKWTKIRDYFKSINI